MLDLDAIRERVAAVTPVLRGMVGSSATFSIPKKPVPLPDADVTFVHHAVRDVDALLEEVDRLRAITSDIRRCYVCHKEILRGRAVVEEPADWDAAE